MIDALKVEAKARGLKSHTTLAIAILLGEQPHLHPVKERSNKTLGVSMRESIWLSVRHRAKFTTTLLPHAMAWMLRGEIPPLTPEEISKGEEFAAKREAERAKGPQAQNPKRKPKSEVKAEDKPESAPPEVPAEEGPEPAPLKVLDEDEEEIEERKRRQARLPKGSSVDPPKSPERNDSGLSNTEEVHFGGIYSL